MVRGDGWSRAVYKTATSGGGRKETWNREEDGGTRATRCWGKRERSKTGGVKAALAGDDSDVRQRNLKCAEPALSEKMSERLVDCCAEAETAQRTHLSQPTRGCNEYLNSEVPHRDDCSCDLVSDLMARLQ